ncbi:MAG: pyridoxal kinase [Hyphomicrobiaceae bacterium]
MARVLLISSDVAYGHVGNAAARFALQRLGHEVLALPTVVLSSHMGYRQVGGTRIEPQTLTGMVGALASNEILETVDAVLTGYLPTTGHVDAAVSAIERVHAESGARRLVMVDPVLGDDPGGLYVDKAAAVAVRDRLVPLAGILTPNRFELAWLSGAEVHDARSAQAAARRLTSAFVLATSIPANRKAQIDNVLVTASNAIRATVKRRARVPHGTGDLLAALMLGHLLSGMSQARALGLAVGGIEAVIEASAGAPELRLVQSQAAWFRPKAWPVGPVG